MSRELAKSYDPKHVEGEVYRQWEASGFFDPDNLPLRHGSGQAGKRGKPFTIIMPPPNANGALHLGHAVFVTLQDIMMRFRRMQGRKTLWLPGADHAGFETQVVFDKRLEKEGRNRFQIPRDELFREMWDFTMANKVVMEGQLRKLGASCDWSREKFTLDPDIVAVVTDTFARLYEDGLLYRGERIVNWCVKHQTALSDLEVRYEERTDPLYHIRYGPLVLATVRPETKFGDTAVAVHPKDKRYREYVGKELEIETLIGRATIKVIADDAVDPTFGTGVIKVTPAHDPTDFEIAKRHDLEVRPVIGKDGRLNEKTGPYAGLKVAEARTRVADDMAARGLMEKIEPGYKHNVAVCYKCGTVLEPLVMPQWFMRMTEKPHPKTRNSKLGIRNSGKSLRDMAVDAVKSRKVRLIPDRTKKVFFHWMANLRDWNISRQISWGIRIPAWYCIGCGDVRIKPRIKGNWYFVRHGETDWNVERRIQGQGGDAPLNENGRKQATEAGALLADNDIDVVISSDLMRTRETAEIIAEKIGVAVFFDPALRERSYGALEGKTRDDLAAMGYPDMASFDSDHTVVVEGVEGIQTLEERISKAIRNHHSQHPEKNVVIVSHGATLRALLGKLKNLGVSERANLRFHNAAIVHLAVAGDCSHCGSDFVEQDPDVLDTWFSSGQWPFATLLAQRGNSKFPENSKDFEEFYPTDVMETGYDILFFWVARMIMFGLYRTGKVPFKTVYLHGLVRDKDRQKMSKSKGNVIDPLGVAEQYGTDAVRMALTVGNIAGQDLVVSEEKIRGYRNFANKLWNIHRFITMRYTGAENIENIENIKNIKAAYSPSDKKRLKELRALTKKVTEHLETFKFHHAADALYHYVWHTFADDIIESVKPRLEPTHDARDRAAAQSLLVEIHATALKLLHPFMPFITEELWGNMQTMRVAPARKDTKGLLMVEPWPTK